MNILIVSTGGGGGNILRSLKTLFHRDVMVTQKADASYAARLRGAVTTCCIDTNEFSLSDLPAEERLLIGPRTTGRLGARHNPDVARQALEESKSEVEALMRRHAVIILIGTGGKGTGAGTMFPLAEMARGLKKLVIPIFVRPSFERHEVDKRRYDHALKVSQQFDAARIRFMEILNDRGYADSDPQSQSVVWERMNLPIARGLRGLIYVLWDLSQVDPSDLSTMFAGPGRLRIGFGEIHPPAGQEPTGEQVERAVRDCWDNLYCTFSKPAGTSLICIQGEWSNVVDAAIKGRLATLAMAGAADSPYTPLSARALPSPRPWGVTALLAEYTGAHAPLEIDWGFEKSIVPTARPETIPPSRDAAVPPPQAADPPRAAVERPVPQPPVRAFATLWEFAVAVNRSDPAALAMAGNGAKAGIPIDGADVKKLVGTVWFRSVFPRLSQEWRGRLLDALVESVELQNAPVRVGRRTARLQQFSYGDLQQVAPGSVTDVVRSELALLVAVGQLWGNDALTRFRCAENPASREPSKLLDFLHAFRG